MVASFRQKPSRFNRFLAWCFGLLVLFGSASAPGASPDYVEVTAVWDGDSLCIKTADGEEDKVRLIGVEAPETHHPSRGQEPYGEEATLFAQGLLKPGDKVALELDVETRDKYGRLLAYVYLAKGPMLNAEMLRSGYAQLLTVPPNVRYSEKFRTLQAEARSQNRGLWAQPVTVDAEQASQHLGSYARVTGRIADVRRSRRGDIYLNFGLPYPSQHFACAIFRENVECFPDPQSLKGQTVEVWGVIRKYRGKPQMVLHSAAQLRKVK